MTGVNPKTEMRKTQTGCLGFFMTLLFYFAVSA
ncbi:hypothetical protein F942_00314 [Acinetobacter ursingii ANC 3649]|uniref:Uncharacterized protein n=1 Tax=Acinetobacter ursingii ANC 3649 TaxID=1257043 RepID=N9DK65_9GAMM|nr:hypothetical protein F942_00314 [Acinetobacter ursingii ANC 3649]